MMNRVILAGLILSVVSFFSCGYDEGEEFTCQQEPNLSNVDEEQLEEDIIAIDAYLEENNIEAQAHSSGLRYVIVDEGDEDGRNPGLCQNIVINYEGRLIPDPGYYFDKSNPDNPVIFRLNNLILGWQVGLPLIKEGGKIILYVPSQLAYGERSSHGLYPANANMKFTIELLGVQ